MVFFCLLGHLPNLIIHGSTRCPKRVFQVFLFGKLLEVVCNLVEQWYLLRKLDLLCLLFRTVACSLT